MRASRSVAGIAARLGVVAAMAWGASGTPAGADPRLMSPRDRVAEGARLFANDWSLDRREGRSGDGLGPLFNERSCVACHGQGGTGGAGGAGSDVQILTDTGSPRKPDGSIDFKMAKPADPKVPQAPLASDVWSAFAASPSVVLHRFGADPGYEQWREEALGHFKLGGRPGPSSTDFGGLRIRSSKRNTPALFGDGLIDAIPDWVIAEAAYRQHPGYPKAKGRVGRLEDGRIGRFGWKAQTGSLGDFVRIACANELGLENPGHAQPPDPLRPGVKAPGFDLTESECSSLTAFVASLPRPVEPQHPSLTRAAHLDQGRRAFEEVGCAACHLPELGGVEGIYSDLLLHDMGSGLSDTAEYYGTPPTPGLAFAPPKGSEWRTPPLWGLRDSAPYLHDGRAPNVAGAIAAHGGEAQASVEHYRKLDRRRKGYLDEFLLSMAAPPKPATPRASRAR